MPLRRPFVVPFVILLLGVALGSSGCRLSGGASEGLGCGGKRNSSAQAGTVDSPDSGEGEGRSPATETTREKRHWELTDEEAVIDRPRAVGPPLSPEGGLPSLAPLVERLTPTVVGVTTRTRTAEAQRPLPPGVPMPPGPPREREEIGIGSGVIIDPDGLVLTNNHVIAGADEVEVTLSDERQFEAEVVGADPETDIAVLRLVDVEEPLPAATLGRSDDLLVGDYVIAIGNPFGLALTVTAGIVSATARVIGTSPFDDFLQTDAAINPGNSGGPLFDLEGRVIGVNTAIVAPGEGIGFAVPIDLIRALLPELVERGRVVRGYMGVVVQDLTPGLARDLEVDVDRGAMVVGVERRGPAERAGLEPGDAIVAVNDNVVEGAASLSREVARLAPGDTARLEIRRDGEPRIVEIELSERPGNDDSPGR